MPRHRRRRQDRRAVPVGGRIYDPEARRFLTPDPLVENPTNSQTLNRYAYVANNPTTHTDPTGYQRSASYWDRPPQSFDARLEGVSKVVIYRLSNGNIVILLFRNTGSTNGKAATSAASDDDAGKKAGQAQRSSGGAAPSTPDKDNPGLDGLEHDDTPTLKATADFWGIGSDKDKPKKNTKPSIGWKFEYKMFGRR